LSQLGYNSGGVLMRLSFQKTAQPLSDAMREIDQYFKTEEQQDSAPQEAKKVVSEDKVASTSKPAAPSSQSNDPMSKELASTGVASSATTTEGPSTTQHIPGADGAMDTDEPISPGSRPVTIFSPSTSSTPLAALRPDSEADYMPDIANAIAHQRRLKTLGENKRLPSDQELEEKAATEEAKVTAVKSIKIKVRFPDDFSAEWGFRPEDSGAGLYAAVRGVMANSSAPFRLMLPGRTPIEDKDNIKLIKGYGLRGNHLVHFNWDDKVPADVRRQPLLKASAAGQAQQVVVPDVPEIEVEDERPSAPAPKPRDDGEGSGSKRPKWLKGFGKK
jgi:tether containing UBX domain for GLUT4